ncbi:SDR family oxidoreductase [Citricoccus alkalitolerans]
MLAARSEDSLQEVGAECAARGAATITVPTDVSDAVQVTALMRSAREAFGRVDVCVAAASVYSYGTFQDTPPEVFQRIIEVNLLGVIHTARAVLAHFRDQGRGTLIVIGSVYSRLTSPYVSPYVTSKYGLLGFTEVLRQELREADDIHVCAVLPATIDTPIYQHAANYTGKRVHPLPPVVSAHRVARAIVRVAHRPRPVTVIGRTQRMLIPVHDFSPRLYDRCITPVMNVLALRHGTVPASNGTVFAPRPATNQITGNWRSTPIRALGAIGAILVGWSCARRGRH